MKSEKLRVKRTGTATRQAIMQVTLWHALQHACGSGGVCAAHGEEVLEGRPAAIAAIAGRLRRLRRRRCRCRPGLHCRCAAGLAAAAAAVTAAGAVCEHEAGPLLVVVAMKDLLPHLVVQLRCAGREEAAACDWTDSQRAS